MSEPIIEARLERELREVLRRRDPGTAPYGLAGRIDRIAAEVRRERRSRAARTLVSLAGVAAAAATVLGVVAASRLGLQRDAIVGGVTVTPPPEWQAQITGAGLVPYPDIASMGLAFAVATIGLVVLAIGLAALRRPFAALGTLVVAVLVPIVVAGLTLLPAATASEDLGSSTGPLRVVEMPPGFTGEALAYVVAEPGGLFSTAFTLGNEGPVPVTVQGFVQSPDLPKWVEVQLLPDWVPPRPGVERDVAGVPFEPIELSPGQMVQVRLIGTPGECGMGEAFDPNDTTTPVSYLPMTITIRSTVLGWPRADRATLSQKLVVPTSIACLDRLTAGIQP